MQRAAVVLFYFEDLPIAEIARHPRLRRANRPRPPPSRPPPARRAAARGGRRCRLTVASAARWIALPEPSSPTRTRGCGRAGPRPPRARSRWASALAAAAAVAVLLIGTRYPARDAGTRRRADGEPESPRRGRRRLQRHAPRRRPGRHESRSRRHVVDDAACQRHHRHRATGHVRGQRRGRPYLRDRRRHVPDGPLLQRLLRLGGLVRVRQHAVGPGLRKTAATPA